MDSRAQYSSATGPHTFGILQPIKSTELTIEMPVTMEMVGMNKRLGRAVECEEEPGDVATMAARNLSLEPGSPQFGRASAEGVTKHTMAEMRSFNGLILQNLIETMTSDKYM